MMLSVTGRALVDPGQERTLSAFCLAGPPEPHCLIQHTWGFSLEVSRQSLVKTIQNKRYRKCCQLLICCLSCQNPLIFEGVYHLAWDHFYSKLQDNGADKCHVVKESSAPDTLKGISPNHKSTWRDSPWEETLVTRQLWLTHAGHVLPV